MVVQGSRSVLVAVAVALAGCGGAAEPVSPPASAEPPAPVASAPTVAAAPAPKQDDARIDELRVVAEDAWIYAFPLVLMDTTARYTTAVAKPESERAPMNQLARATKFPEPDNKQVVSINLDTLYVQGFFDLSKEPLVLSAPPAGKRYYLLPVLDAWSNVFAVPGTRATGPGPGTFALVGPGWSGKLPPGVKEYRSPTQLAWLIGRVQTNGKADYPGAIAFEKGVTVVPLSAYGKPQRAPADVPVDASVDTKNPPVLQVVQMEPKAFFARATELMATNPAYPADAPALERFKAIGFVPGKPFEPTSGDPRVLAALQGTAERATARLKKAVHELATARNGWRTYMGTGEFGTDYTKRATIAFFGFGANLNVDALGPRTEVDGEGKPLAGDKAYVLHFEKGDLPPAKAFWSVTMYDQDQFLVPNPIGRYALGDRDKLVFGKDGSLDVIIQNASPGKDREANWLPAPKGPFNLILRIYWPKPEALEGTYAPPAVRVTK